MRRFAVLAGALLLACHGATPESPWPRRAHQDIAAAYDAYAANHPGMHDRANPGFPARLAAARDAAWKVDVRDHAGYVEALGVFNAELADGHARLVARHALGPSFVLWPGFVAAWRGDALYVHDAGPGAPAPVGARITACNGTPIATFLEQRLHARDFRPKEAGQWWLRAPRAFTTTPDTLLGHPERCTFDGREVTLAWTDAPSDLEARIARATDGERTEIGITEPRPGIFLVGMPTFAPAGPDGYEAYRDLRIAIVGQHRELAAARAIILDLRHNDGEDKMYGIDVGAALWGTSATFARSFLHDPKLHVGWRASPDNIGYLTELRAKSSPASADTLAWIVDQMREANARGEAFYDAPPTASVVPPPTDLHTPVYVITSGRCATGCLDVLDVATQFPGTKRIGAPTSADSTYGEVRQLPLPSGEATATIPMKLYAERARRAGEVYRPDIEVDDLDWSTKTFLDRIERDLAH